MLGIELVAVRIGVQERDAFRPATLSEDQDLVH
jgi:hypothetical protein